MVFPFLTTAAHCCGSPVQVDVTVICQRPVLTFSGWKSAAATKAAPTPKQTTATAIALLILSSFDFFDSVQILPIFRVQLPRADSGLARRQSRCRRPALWTRNPA